METVIQDAIFALSLGGVYALLALGIALIFGIMRLINFAHGELLMVGGYALLLLTGPPWPIVFAGAVALVVLCAIAMERIAFRPVRGADPPTLLVTSFAVSFLLQNVALLTKGGRALAVPLPSFLNDSIVIGEIRIAVLSLVSIAVTLLFLVSLAGFFRRASLGLQMRAAAEDFQVARLQGVRANRVIAAAFALSGVLAGAASILLIAQVGSVSPVVGLTPVIIAFVATILGGLGNLVGAVVGGFTLGILQVALQSGLPIEMRPYRDAFLFGVVILILLVRPQGILPNAGLQERV